MLLYAKSPTTFQHDQTTLNTNLAVLRFQQSSCYMKLNNILYTSVFFSFFLNYLYFRFSAFYYLDINFFPLEQHIFCSLYIYIYILQASHMICWLLLLLCYVSLCSLCKLALLNEAVTSCRLIGSIMGGCYITRRHGPSTISSLCESFFKITKLLTMRNSRSNTPRI